MTYCVAVALEDGLILTSDSRTNAGIDQVSTYSKMYRCETIADRSLIILSAGNLATSQGVIERVQRDMQENAADNLNNIKYLADIADYLGDILSKRIKRFPSNQHNGLSLESSLILAGQIEGECHQAFLIYPQGNHITTSAETPYLQIGESKYGKPVLDRFLTMQTSLGDAATCALISMDSTMKSNASVGPPIELLTYQKDSLSLGQHYNFEADHPYLTAIRKEWGDRLNQAFREMPPLSDFVD